MANLRPIDIPLSSFAEKTTYEVSSMAYISSCVKTIKAQVCKTEGLEKFEISIGKLVISQKRVPL